MSTVAVSIPGCFSWWLWFLVIFKTWPLRKGVHCWSLTQITSWSRWKRGFIRVSKSVGVNHLLFLMCSLYSRNRVWNQMMWSLMLQSCFESCVSADLRNICICTHIAVFRSGKSSTWNYISLRLLRLVHVTTILGHWTCWTIESTEIGMLMLKMILHISILMMCHYVHQHLRSNYLWEKCWNTRTTILFYCVILGMNIPLPAILWCSQMRFDPFWPVATRSKELLLHMSTDGSGKATWWNPKVAKWLIDLLWSPVNGQTWIENGTFMGHSSYIIQYSIHLEMEDCPWPLWPTGWFFEVIHCPTRPDPLIFFCQRPCCGMITRFSLGTYQAHTSNGKRETDHQIDLIAWKHPLNRI